MILKNALSNYFLLFYDQGTYEQYPEGTKVIQGGAIGIRKITEKK